LNQKKGLIKTESDKKYFIIRSIPPLKEYLYHFQEFYKFITPSFLNKNDVIYIQETEADKVFLIYKGSIRIEKILEIDFIKEMSKKDQELNFLQAKQKKSKMLMRMDKGNIFGYEALEKNKKYKFTAKSDCEGTIIFCIKIQHSRFKYIIKAIKEYFEPIFLKNEKLLLEKIEHLIENQLKMKVAYRGQDVKKCGNYKLNKKEEREFLHRVNEKIYDIRKENLNNLISEEKNRSLVRVFFKTNENIIEEKNKDINPVNINTEEKNIIQRRPISNMNYKTNFADKKSLNENSIKIKF